VAKVASDPQRNSLYAWEGKWDAFNRKTDTLADCRKYVHTACAYYGIPPPTVGNHGGRAYSWYQADGNYAHTRTVRVGGKCHSAISFNRERGLNIPTALHEAAHAVASVLLPWEMADHDPRFVGIYLWLLVKAKIAPRSALEASLLASGVNWDKKTTPKNLKKKAP
jgi:hypothetical protein